MGECAGETPAVQEGRGRPQQPALWGVGWSWPCLNRAFELEKQKDQKGLDSHGDDTEMSQCWYI